jgi:hypothetical protein
MEVLRLRQVSIQLTTYGSLTHEKIHPSAYDRLVDVNFRKLPSSG